MKKLILVLIAAMALPVMAQTAAPSRIAVINVQKVLADSNAGKNAFDRLQKLQEEKAARAKRMDDELKALDTQMAEKRLSLSEDKLADLKKQFDDKKIALQRYAQDADRELSDARDASLQDLEKQIMPVISSLGKEMGFAVIFNKYESGLVFASDAIDITDVVVKRFNETTPAPAAAASAPKK